MRDPRFLVVRSLPSVFALLAAGLGCDPGTTVPERDGAAGDDAGMSADTGSGSVDAGTPSDDAGTDAGPPPEVDAGEPVVGLQCEVCEEDVDCGSGSYCVALPSGGQVCLRACQRDLPSCPPRFDCIFSLITELPDPVCTPVGERCCVDADADDHGTGVGCRGLDCDETDPGSHEGAAELCDGADNDCDGNIDEGNPGGGAVCTTGLAGACSAGVTTCEDGAVLCRSSASSIAETCDGVDQDCDGNVDEDDLGRALTRECYDGDPSTMGVGACTVGIQTCAGGEFRSCVGQALPSTDGCDGDDNDCDGNTDEGNPGGGIACTTLSPGVCSPGVTTCAGGSVTCAGTIAPGDQAEICDASDNDCDASTDEGFPGLRTTCTAGRGVCRRAGVTICDPSDLAGPPICDVTAGTPAAAEACDYVDDDCDGNTDEGFVDLAGLYSSDQHCGACGISCPAIFAYPNSFGVCQVMAGRPQCALGCDAGAFNLNGVPNDGCEFLLDAGGIYVSGEDPAAIDNAGCGLGPVGTGPGRYPCRTIAQGITRAGATSRARVLVADALYQEDVTIVSGVSLLGGHRADTWERHVSTTLTAIRGTSGAGHRRAITATNISATTLVEGFIVDGASASTAGANSYAVYVSGGTSALTLRSNVVYAGNGAPGAAGGAGTDGAGGVGGTGGANAFDTGSNACTTSNAGPAGGARSCGGTSVNGGNGGGVFCAPVIDTSAPFTPGSARVGVAGSGPGAGAGGAAAFDGQTQPATSCFTCFLGGSGATTLTMTGGNGVAGGNGTNGTLGAGAASGTGSVTANEWVGAGGGNGALAAHGGGGGGGGSGGGGDGSSGACTDDLGATGGGGGSGGCGGTLGSGGGAGGGSFGIFIVNTTNRPTLTGNTIYRGFGGTGGNGGRGGVGGTGGPGASGGLKSNANASFCTGDGGGGGDGGNGGHGGGGGGGAGGVAYGIFASGTTGYGVAGNTFPVSGGGGTGGGGGPSLGNSGTGGAAGATGTTN